MIRVHLRFARPTMHLARPLAADDGALLAGVGTRLTRPLTRALRDSGVESVWVREVEGVADWEEDKDLDRALAALTARFADEPPDPVLLAVRDTLRLLLLRRVRTPGAGEP